jgi:hypothetical protein
MVPFRILMENWHRWVIARFEAHTALHVFQTRVVVYNPAAGMSFVSLCCLGYHLVIEVTLWGSQGILLITRKCSALGMFLDYKHISWFRTLTYPSAFFLWRSTNIVSCRRYDFGMYGSTCVYLSIRTITKGLATFDNRLYPPWLKALFQTELCCGLYY